MNRAAELARLAARSRVRRALLGGLMLAGAGTAIVTGLDGQRGFSEPAAQAKASAAVAPPEDCATLAEEIAATQCAINTSRELSRWALHGYSLDFDPDGLAQRLAELSTRAQAGSCRISLDGVLKAGDEAHRRTREDFIRAASLSRAPSNGLLLNDCRAAARAPLAAEA